MLIATIFPPIYLYSCSPHPLYISMLFPTVFWCFCAYFTWRWFDAFYYFFVSCKTPSIIIWFVLATGLADNMTQVIFRQPFVIQQVRTRLLNSETWNFRDIFIFSLTWNQLVMFDVIVFPLAAFVLFRDLSHQNAWINHTESESNHSQLLVKLL